MGYTATIAEQDGENTAKIGGHKVKAVRELRDGEQFLGMLTKSTKDADDLVTIGSETYGLRRGKKRNSVLFHRKGFVALIGDDGATYYAACYDFRWPLLLLAAIPVCLICYKQSPAATTPTPAQEIETDLDDDAGSIDNTPVDPNIRIGGSIQYVSPDEDCMTWKANETHQMFRITNVSANTDDLAAHIYVDLNGDSEITESECVYNPITYDDKGNVSSYGTFLAPGTEVQEIDLVKTLDAGTYDAKLAFTAVDRETKTLDNPMAFEFTLAVQ